MISFCKSLTLLLLLDQVLTRPMTDQMAALQSLPPVITIMAPGPALEKKVDKPSDAMNSFLTNTLLQALAEQSDYKRRVQRYRDIS